MDNLKNYRQIALAASLSVALSIASSVSASNWNTTSGNWSVAGNWIGGVPGPGASANIVFTNGVARTVTYDVASSNLGLTTVDLTGAGTTTNTLAITSNNTLAASGLLIGGYDGTTFTRTNGRGAMTQSNGSVLLNSGTDFALGNGTGSSGTYTLSGGSINAVQSEFIGYQGVGIMTQSGGTNTIQTSTVGTLKVGYLAGSVGTYNLSGGSLTSNTYEIVGDFGTGIFNHTGGTNTINAANLTLGANSGGTGTYTLSNNAALGVGYDMIVGTSATAKGTFTVQDNAVAAIGLNLLIRNQSTVNFSGGTLKISHLVKDAGGTFNYTGGTVQFPDSRTIGSDSDISTIFGSTPSIPTGKGLIVDGFVDITSDLNIAGGKLTAKSFGGPYTSDIGGSSDRTVTISADGDAVFENTSVALGRNGNSVTSTLRVTGNGSTLTSGNALRIGNNGRGVLQIDSAGVVTNAGNATLGYSVGDGIATVTGQGSTWNIGGDLTVGSFGTGSLDIGPGGTVSVGNVVSVTSTGSLNINGGTLRLVGFTAPAGVLHYNYGTVTLAGGNRTFSTDPVIPQIFGDGPLVLTAGRNLTVEGTAILDEPLTLNGGTLRATGFAMNSTFQFTGGVLQVDGGSISNITSLNIPTNGELRVRGTQPLTITGAAGSTINLTGITQLGSATAVNGFATQGSTLVGQTVLTLLDANDVVFDALSYTSIGNGVNGGVINATNGLTLNFGGNIVGLGNINSTNASTKPLINNGHIAGTSSLLRISLSGYVKGVGTFDNVTTTGTFSPGLSPAVVATTNLTLGSTGTLLMELGGMAVGSGYDQVQDAGQLTLGGVLQVALINGFVPAAGNSFDLLNWSTLSGTFSSLDLPTLAGGLAWNTSQLYTTGVLSIASAGTPGDYNNDGTVDAGDYIVWRKNQGTTNTLPNDPTGGSIGAAQFNTWRTNFGRPLGSGAGDGLGDGAAVPEPTSLLLLATAFVGCVAARRDRRRR